MVGVSEERNGWNVVMKAFLPDKAFFKIIWWCCVFGLVGGTVMATIKAFASAVCEFMANLTPSR